MTPLPWQFEECSPEDATDPAGQPWRHAVRGRKPAGRLVIGYGHTAPAADADARTKATQYDAREVLGERGEVKAPATLMGLPVAPWDDAPSFEGITFGVVLRIDATSAIMQALGTNYALIDGTVEWVGRTQPIGT